MSGSPAAALPPIGQAGPAAPVSSIEKPIEKPTEALREQHLSETEADLLTREKAIAAAALEPPELGLRITAPGTPASGAVSIPPLPKLDAPTAFQAPGVANPPGGLRVPTPELAAAFLASIPAPATTARDAASASSPEAASSKPSRPKSRKSANPEQILFIVGSILAVLIGGGLTGVYLYLRTPPKAPVPAIVADEPPPPDEPAAAPVTPAPGSPEAAVTPATNSTPSAPTAGTSTDPSTPAAPAATDQPPAASAAAPKAPEPPPPRVNTPNPTILAWVQKIELTGIRSGPVQKAFMNGKLYEVGETVNFQLGLKLLEIRGKTLRFEDSEGNTYEYRF